jgi:NitT/TauT family transport system substrate-binding protein
MERSAMRGGPATEEESRISLRFIRATRIAATVLAVFVLAHSAASALEQLKVSVGGRGAFDNQISEVGQQQGFFKRHGLTLDLRYSQGGGETLQAVITGTADVGVPVGTLAALAAFANGAPVRVVGSAMIGATEFWYVPANSRIRGLKEAAGKKVAYSATGAATNLMVLGLQELHGVKFQPVATGDPAATLARVMSVQVDVGYSVPPFAVAELEQQKIRIVGRGNDLPALGRQTVRFIVVNANALEQRPDAVRRYLQGYRDTVEWLFSSDPQAISAYAGWAGISESVARRSRDDFIAKQNVLPDQISGLDAILADAVTYKVVGAPLTAEQVKTLIQPQPPMK